MMFQQQEPLCSSQPYYSISQWNGQPSVAPCMYSSISLPFCSTNIHSN